MDRTPAANNMPALNGMHEANGTPGADAAASAAEEAALGERLARLQARIARAAQESGREAGAVRLLAVSKGQPPQRLRAARRAGLRDFAENYLQEARRKEPLWEEPRLCRHYIGRVQSNKTRALAQHFDWVHSVDSERSAAALSAHRPAGCTPLAICLQLALPHQEHRPGVAAQALPALAAYVASLPRLRLRGIMALAPRAVQGTQAEEYFAQVREAFVRLRSGDYGAAPVPDTLCMGMSADFEAAIRAGSTMVRIGSALFGARLDRPQQAPHEGAQQHVRQA